MRKHFLKTEQPNLTPLIDCVFLLLIFFMVCTVFITPKGIKVDLPAPGKAEESPVKDINVVIDESGNIELNGEPVKVADLVKEMAEAKKVHGSRNVIIQADRKVKHRLVVKVMDSAKEVGVEGIAFAFEKGQE